MSTRLSPVIQSNARTLAGKRDSRRDSTTSFSENVVVEETSYQVLEVLKDNSASLSSEKW